MDMMDIGLPCLYCFLACIAIGIVFNIQRNHLVLAAIGGTLGWATYLLCHFESDVLCYFVAALVISLYGEIMARFCKAPVTSFLTVAVIPMVPGGGMYYTMEYCIRGETELFATTGLHTLAIAGAIALGIVTVSSLVRLWKIMRKPGDFHREMKENKGV